MNYKSSQTTALPCLIVGVGVSVCVCVVGRGGRVNYIFEQKLLLAFDSSLDTIRKLEIHKTVRRCPGRFHVSCTFSVQGVLMFRIDCV